MSGCCSDEISEQSDISAALCVMSEDEEIVFEGHELHHYLCQQGFTDFEVVRCSSPLQGPQIKKCEFLRHQVFLVTDGS